MVNRSITLLSLLLLVAGLLSVSNPTYVNYNTNGWTGAQIDPQATWRPWTNPNDLMVGSDRAQMDDDYFNDTRIIRPSGMARLMIDRPSGCSGEDIFFKVTYQGQPVKGADVALYSHTGGRTLVGEVYTDANGQGAFIRQVDGGYDLYAKAADWPYGLVIFRVGPCPPSFDAYGQKLDLSPTTSTPTRMAIVYPSGITRTLQTIPLPEGRTGTQVTIGFAPDRAQANLSLMEAVPPGLATRPQAIGFESDYPTKISNTTPIELQWTLPSVAAGRTVERSYVLLRPLHPTMLGQYNEPLVVDEKGQAVMAVTSGLGMGAPGGAGGNGSALANASATANLSSPVSTSSPWDNLFCLVPIGLVVVGLILLLLIRHFWKKLDPGEQTADDVKKA
jgi:hypothetical protein